MTAELAVTLPAVVLLLAVLLVTAAATTVQLRCADGARAGARVAALGQDDAQVAAVARRVAGDAVVVSVRREPPFVEVTVEGAVAPAWFTGGLLGLAATATAWDEP
ncbi:TadE family type IV pilus minor pilin [Actinotalea sp. K2]|uniref:TadE family type IV pilus minor pilin n=1 Tax=Actinotalea sp. K2 TaxID=2939438 RepID=UPI0020171D25|nr:TadE family type IV pilus minor pilin [Actinotalea sp. K2]MCL3861373.1 TadE family protein [Actinotalea sp. K2]